MRPWLRPGRGWSSAAESNRAEPMSEYLHVEKPFLDQLATLGWTVIDQGQGFIPSDPAASLRESFREWLLPEVFRSAVRALAETHVELVLIHPFRDGNGRLARVLSTLMALQAGLPLLDFRVIAGEKKGEYFSAVRAGLEKAYVPMERLFAEIIERSLAAS